MDYIKEIEDEQAYLAEAIKEKAGQVIKIKAMVHKIREMRGFAFVILRAKRDLIQCVYSEETSKFELKDIKDGDAVEVEGKVILNDKVINGYEIAMERVEILSHPVAEMPIVINQKELDVGIEVNLDERPVSLRHVKQRAIFKIQEGLARGFREYLTKQNFTEIRTPKIVFAGAEGGSNIFKLPYFDKEVFLTQSPQFYKQTMVPIFERVFEIAPVFRAEKHDTSRHLNEYISMDMEMGFIKSFRDIMEMEVGILKYTFDLLKREYAREIELLGVKVPEIESIPSMRFDDAKKIIIEQYGKKEVDMHDFEPEEEVMLCDYAMKNYGSELIFITHYPSEKRPFYAMESKDDPTYTESFDLLFRGVEITTGGQRIHDYNEQVAKMKVRGMNVDDFETYLMLHKYGVPPHGGIGLGLERLTVRLLDLPNIRYASLFPRDTQRVTP